MQNCTRWLVIPDLNPSGAPQQPEQLQPQEVQHSEDVLGGVDPALPKESWAAGARLQKAWLQPAMGA